MGRLLSFHFQFYFWFLERLRLLTFLAFGSRLLSVRFGLHRSHWQLHPQSNLCGSLALTRCGQKRRPVIQCCTRRVHTADQMLRAVLRRGNFTLFHTFLLFFSVCLCLCALPPPLRLPKIVASFLASLLSGAPHSFSLHVASGNWPLHRCCVLVLVLGFLFSISLGLYNSPSL